MLSYIIKQKIKICFNISLDIITQYKDMILENTSYDIIDGLAGVLIVVLNLYELSKDKELEDLSIKIGKNIIRNIQIENECRNGYRNGVGQEFDSPSFMLGLSGIGYEMLRLSVPMKYPSVLLLEV